MYIYSLCILQNWTDYRLNFTASDFGHLDFISVPASKMWKPDLLLINKWEHCFLRRDNIRFIAINLRLRLLLPQTLKLLLNCYEPFRLAVRLCLRKVGLSTLWMLCQARKINWNTENKTGDALSCCMQQSSIHYTLLYFIDRLMLCVCNFFKPWKLR